MRGSVSRVPIHDRARVAAMDADPELARVDALEQGGGWERQFVEARGDATVRAGFDRSPNRFLELLGRHGVPVERWHAFRDEQLAQWLKGRGIRARGPKAVSLVRVDVGASHSG